MANVVVTLVTKLNEKGLKDFRASLKDLDSNIISGLKGGLVGIGGAAAVGFGVAASESLQFADQANAAMSKFSAQTGIAGDELEDYRAIALDLFAGGFGEDIDAVADAMAEVAKQTDATGDDLQKSTRRALQFAKRMDKDVGEVSHAAGVLMKEFGFTSDEAFDFLATGIQSGLDNSGDFLDSIGEYSNLFASAGTDAAQFFNLMESGLAGAC